MPAREKSAPFEITVEARRLPFRAAADKSAAASVIPGSRFEAPVVSVASLLKEVPGVKTTSFGDLAAASNVSIRGAAAEQTKIHLDGILLNPAGGGAFDLSTLPLVNVSRVEIYRGAGPLYLGAGAIGGSLNIVTEAPDRRELVTAAGGGSWLTRQAGVSYSEPGTSVGFLAGLSYLGSAGNFSFDNDNGTLFEQRDDRTVTRQNNRFNQGSALGRLRWQPDRNWRVTFSDAFFLRDQGVPGLAIFETDQSHLSQLQNVAYVSVEADHALVRKGLFRLQPYLLFARSAFQDPLSEIGLGKQDTDDFATAAGLQGYHHAPLASWFAWDNFLEYRFDRFAPENLASTVAGKSSDRHYAAAATQPEVIIKSLNTTFIPAGRLEYAHSRTHGTGLLDQPESAATEVDHLLWSYRIGMVQQPLEWLAFKANIARATRLPSFTELFGNSGYVLGNPSLRPEEGLDIDAGFTVTAPFRGGRDFLLLDFFAFRNALTDLIQYVQTAQNVSRAQNIEQALIKGVEAGLHLDTLSHLNLQGSYTLMLSKQESQQAGWDGKVLPLRPASRWFARPEFYWVLGKALWRLGVYAEAEWQAGNFLDRANLVAVSDRLVLSSGLDFSFWRKRLVLSAAGRNLTDNRIADLAGFPLPGRSVFFRLTYSWFEEPGSSHEP